MSETLLTDLRLCTLDMPEPLQRGLADAGFEYCTKIQAEALPLALAGVSVAGQAQTGTGKTAAFLLATMAYLLRHEPFPGHRPGDPRALVVAPTRELAVQIYRDAELLGRHTGIRTVVVYGGEGYEEQRDSVARGVDILVGTPGRLIDYLRQRVFGLGGVQVAVIDEADRMFDLGFIRDIRFLLRRLPRPEKRLNMMFSATLTLRVTELAYEHMNAPQVVNVAPDKVTADKVVQVLYHCSKDEKIALLLGLFKLIDPRRSLVFANTKRAAERVRAYLVGNGFDAEVLSGDVPQKQRMRLLNRFQQGNLPVLVATDVAARGLHIPDVSHVFNFDLPQDAEDYVHRIGRTARAGATGDAVSLACEEYVFSLAEIEAYIGHKIPVGEVSDELMVRPAPPVREPRPRLAVRPGGRGDERRRGRPPRVHAAPAAGGGTQAQAGSPPGGEAPATRRPPRRRRRRSGIPSAAPSGEHAG